MNEAEGLNFLREHQPMPADEEMTAELIQMYDTARKYFVEHPNFEAASLFLTSFGDRSGFGIYMLVDEVLNAFSSDELAPAFVKALTNPAKSVRYWSADLAASFPHPALVEPLGRLLVSDDEDLRSAAIIALGQISNEKSRQLLRIAQEIEHSSELRELLADTLGDEADNPEG